MNWSKLIYVLIIVLLYIPMVFLGANIFFPEYTGENSHYRYDYDEPRVVYDAEMTEEERALYNEEQKEIRKENEAERQVWEAKKNAYEGNKYVIITIFNLIILLAAIFIPLLKDSIMMGLFLGSAATTFGATIRYFDTNSKVGFVILVLTFIALLYFINKKKDMLVPEKKGKKKKRKKK